jgi:mannitol/fructose-specific phosphotransferase system IIA component (Ntr-type)
VLAKNESFVLLQILNQPSKKLTQAYFVSNQVKTCFEGKATMQTMQVDSLFRFTETALLVPRLAASHHESIIIELANRLESAGRIESSPVYVDAVLAHEELASAVFDDVAFPVAHSKTVKELSFAFGITPQPLHWRTIGAPVISMVVLIAVPFAEEVGYLSLLTSFCDFLKNKTTVSQLKHCVRSEEISEIFSHAHA